VLLESKLDDFRKEVRALRSEAGADGGMGSASTDAAINKVHSLEAQLGFASCDKEAAVEALAVLRTDHDARLEQQTHWEDLRRATENLDHLSTLITRFQANEQGAPPHPRP